MECESFDYEGDWLLTYCVTYMQTYTCHILMTGWT
jgi:hypothetical protein